MILITISSITIINRWLGDCGAAGKTIGSAEQSIGRDSGRALWRRRGGGP